MPLALPPKLIFHSVREPPRIEFDASEKSASRYSRSELRGQRGTYRGVQLRRTPLNSQPNGLRWPRNNVKMDVKNGLMGQGPVVLKQVVRWGSSDFHDCPRDPGQYSPHRSSGLIAQLIKRRGFLFGNHQRVPRANGKDVEKRQDMRILVDLEAWNLAPDDL